MELPLGNHLIPYGSPFHVTQVAMVLLKAVFSELPEDHPYHFTSEYETTGILFDIAYNKASKIWGDKPLVTVGRGSQSVGVLMVGDLATRNLQMSSRHASNLVQSAVDVRVISKSRAECEIISERIFSTFMMMRVMLPKMLGVHMVESISMSPAQQFELDDMCYQVDVTMQYSVQYKWDHATPVTLLQGVDLHIDAVDIPNSAAGKGG